MRFLIFTSFCLSVLCSYGQWSSGYIVTNDRESIRGEISVIGANTIILKKDDKEVAYGPAQLSEVVIENGAQLISNQNGVKIETETPQFIKFLVRGSGASLYSTFNGIYYLEKADGFFKINELGGEFESLFRLLLDCPKIANNYNYKIDSISLIKLIVNYNKTCFEGAVVIDKSIKRSDHSIGISIGWLESKNEEITRDILMNSNSLTIDFFYTYSLATYRQRSSIVIDAFYNKSDFRGTDNYTQLNSTIWNEYTFSSSEIWLSTSFQYRYYQRGDFIFNINFGPTLTFPLNSQEVNIKEVLKEGIITTDVYSSEAKSIELGYSLGTNMEYSAGRNDRICLFIRYLDKSISEVWLSSKSYMVGISYVRKIEFP